jgi:hypothetical protein
MTERVVALYFSKRVLNDLQMLQRQQSMMMEGNKSPESPKVVDNAHPKQSEIAPLLGDPSLEMRPLAAPALASGIQPQQ